MKQGITRYRNAILLATGLLLLSSSILLEARTDDTPETKSATTPETDARDVLKDAVVNVNVVKRNYDTLSPWNSGTRKGGGSGLLLQGGMILTNAHVAANATFLEVQRHGETRRHEASVLYISHDADLALLTTKEKDLYQDITPLELGELPKAQQEVEVYGFPIGGTTLSVTRGVVSRVEKQNYAHSGENLLAVQVDAAINFGNSGGPVISEGKVVGVAMQSGFFTENIGYMIPTPIIRHFLKDIEDGKQDGFGFPGFLVQSLENPALRRKYGLTDRQTGILVHKTYPDSPSENRIQVGDIITEIDGHKIENNGTVEFRPGEFINYTHYVDLHQLGEQLKLKIIRDGKLEDVALTLDKPGRDYLLVKPNQYDKQPTFFIYGGFVFMPLNQDVLDAMDPVPPSLAALANDPPTTEQQEVVIMTQVLPADINKDYHHDSDLMIRKINGETFSDLKDFYLKMQNANTDFLVLETDDGYQIVIDRKEARDKQPAILARYGINEDRSDDLTDLQPSRLATDTDKSSTTEPDRETTAQPKKI
ncbi:MAG TPA: serine protease [Thiolinea sp.]|nr:serine protease [Thiolinea sp.]